MGFAVQIHFAISYDVIWRQWMTWRCHMTSLAKNTSTDKRARRGRAVNAPAFSLFMGRVCYSDQTKVIQMFREVCTGSCLINRIQSNFTTTCTSIYLKDSITCTQHLKQKCDIWYTMSCIVITKILRNGFNQQQYFIQVICKHHNNYSFITCIPYCKLNNKNKIL